VVELGALGDWVREAEDVVGLKVKEGLGIRVLLIEGGGILGLRVLIVVEAKVTRGSEMVRR